MREVAAELVKCLQELVPSSIQWTDGPRDNSTLPLQHLITIPSAMPMWL
jgi:hypothetical protein